MFIKISELGTISILTGGIGKTVEALLLTYSTGEIPGECVSIEVKLSDAIGLTIKYLQFLN